MKIKDRLELQFISPGGKIVASSYGKFAGRSPSTPEIQQAIDSQQTRHYKGRNPLTGERILAVSSPMIYTNGEVIGVLRYVTSLRNADLQVLMIALIAVTVGLLFIGSIFFLSSFFIRSILVPVSQINATAKRIAAGSYGVQIPGQYDDEIGELVSTINDMSVKIGQAEKTQTEFISSVSHELRTPAHSHLRLGRDAADVGKPGRGDAPRRRHHRAGGQAADRYGRGAAGIHADAGRPLYTACRNGRYPGGV